MVTPFEKNGKTRVVALPIGVMPLEYTIAGTARSRYASPAFRRQKFLEVRGRFCYKKGREEL
jgi:hypothetical protein